MEDAEKIRESFFALCRGRIVRSGGRYYKLKGRTLLKKTKYPGSTWIPAKMGVNIFLSDLCYHGIPSIERLDIDIRK